MQTQGRLASRCSGDKEVVKISFLSVSIRNKC